ncbi:Uncharacterised protein [Achromobacter ruhlandii]|nr:Uncharacterised protein [Achromobacter ruhlandii]CUJ96403.1 Uncharacterised protein [Achromobacter ruhlandii]
MISPPSDSMVALSLRMRLARPAAWVSASSVPPMFKASLPPPALNIRACSRLSSVLAPISSRPRAAMTAARPPSSRLLTAPPLMARWSPWMRPLPTLSSVPASIRAWPPSMRPRLVRVSSATTVARPALISPVAVLSTLAPRASRSPARSRPRLVSRPAVLMRARPLAVISLRLVKSCWRMRLESPLDSRLPSPPRLSAVTLSDLPASSVPSGLSARLTPTSMPPPAVTVPRVLSRTLSMPAPRMPTWVSATMAPAVLSTRLADRATLSPCKPRGLLTSAPCVSRLRIRAALTVSPSPAAIRPALLSATPDRLTFRSRPARTRPPPLLSAAPAIST